MNAFDLIIVIPLLWGAINGFRKGLILELASLLSLFLGIWGSMKFSGLVGNYLGKWLEASESLISLLSFILTFILIVICVYLLARLIDKSLKLAAMGLVLRISGALFGLLKYALILSVLFYGFESLNHNWEFVETEKYQSSYCYQLLSKVNQPIYDWLSQLNLHQLKTESGV